MKKQRTIDADELISKLRKLEGRRLEYCTPTLKLARLENLVDNRLTVLNEQCPTLNTKNTDSSALTEKDMAEDHMCTRTLHAATHTVTMGMKSEYLGPYRRWTSCCPYHRVILLSGSRLVTT